MKPSGPVFFCCCCWKIFYYSFYFHAFDCSAHVFYFFFGSVWKVILFQDFVHFLDIVCFIGIWLLIVVSNDPLYFRFVCCNFSFFISDFIDLSLPFFLMSLAKDFPNFFSFSNNQLLVLLIFPIVSISFPFISTLILMVSFY